jgi:5-methylcytosine-specific restriction endonuclease McrA
MNSVRPKRPRLRLDPCSYEALHGQVLRRDGWRCQFCGSLRDLQVHHMQSRSLLGDDAEENLITLCVRCHQQLHLRLFT